MAIKDCKHCNNEFNSNKHMKNYCSIECYNKAYEIKDKILGEKRIAKLNARFEGKQEGLDYISCPVCSQKVKEITILHVKKHGFKTVQEFKNNYNLDSVKCQLVKDRMKGSNNPGYQHGGKLSPWSEKSGRSKEKIEESKQKAKDNSWGKNPAQYEYWFNKHNGNEEKAKKAYKWHQSNGLKKMVHLYGEEEGTKKWRARNDKWQNTLKSKPISEILEINSKKASFISGRSYSTISKQLFEVIEKDVSDILYGVNEKTIRLQNGMFVRPDCLQKESKKIIEFFGDYWHGNPAKYNENDLVAKGRVAKDVWKADNLRISGLKEKGYKVKVVWESDYHVNKEQVINECVEFLNK